MKQREFTGDFKREAVRILTTSGRSISSVAEDLGIRKTKYQANGPTEIPGRVWMYMDPMTMGKMHTEELALHDPAQRQRVHQRLEQAETLAAEILQKHKLQLEHMAKALVSERELIEPQLSKLLAGIASEPLLLENNMIEPQPGRRPTVSADKAGPANAHKPSERETNKASNTRDAP